MVTGGILLSALSIVYMTEPNVKKYTNPNVSIHFERCADRFWRCAADMIPAERCIFKFKYCLQNHDRAGGKNATNT